MKKPYFVMIFTEPNGAMPLWRWVPREGGIYQERETAFFTSYEEAEREAVKSALAWRYGYKVFDLSGVLTRSMSGVYEDKHAGCCVEARRCEEKRRSLST